MLMRGVPSPVGHKKARGAGDEHEHDRGRLGVDAEVVNIDCEFGTRRIWGVVYKIEKACARSG